jgi:glycosyltransferase involved in cell wall biosynthesis
MFLSKKIILTNEVEKCFARRFLINSNKISIIPIASNIVQSNYSNREFEERKIDLAYFGHIRPIKGIEEFLNAVSTIKNVKEVAIIGQKLEKYSDFFDYIFKKSEELGIKLIVNKKEDEVADFLSNVKIVYLPFPDGISSRRGSLLASINNSCIIVSKRSSNPETNSFFQEHCYLLNNSEEASSLIDQILTTPFALKESTKLRFMFSWDAVVQQHKELYSSLN